MPGRRAVLVTNAAAGQGDRARIAGHVAQALEDRGFQLELAATQSPDHATELAREAAAAGCEVVFALGGDGTLRETAAGLVGTGVPLGPLPGGTTNVLVRALGLPVEPVATARRLAELSPRPLAAGMAGDRLFLMQLSGGLDGRVLASLDSLWKRRFGKAYIGAAALRQFLGYDFPRIAAETDAGERIEGTLVVVANIPLYGGPFVMAPAARTDRPGFELVVLSSAGRFKTLTFALALARGRHLLRQDVALRSVNAVRLSGPPEVVLQFDGDVCPERLPIEIRALDEELLVLAPEA